MRLNSKMTSQFNRFYYVTIRSSNSSQLSHFVILCCGAAAKPSEICWSALAQSDICVKKQKWDPTAIDVLKSVHPSPMKRISFGAICCDRSSACVLFWLSDSLEFGRNGADMVGKHVLELSLSATRTDERFPLARLDKAQGLRHGRQLLVEFEAVPAVSIQRTRNKPFHGAPALLPIAQRGSRGLRQNVGEEPLELDKPRHGDV